MARPTNKQELLLSGSQQFEKLWNLIDTMTEQEQNAPFQFEDRDRNIRDVLTHLFEWHQLLLFWVNKNQKGERRPFLPEPYNWKTYGEMNVDVIWKKHQDTPYDLSKAMLKESHGAVTALIHSFSDEELFTKKFFLWTGTTSLGSYFISSTSSHYDWAIKKIKAHAKTIQKRSGEKE